MKLTQVSLLPTEQANAAGRPALTPELLAASGARYSRNNEGIDAILSKIDPGDMDRSVDRIFRLLDYGHQSIADMAPVAIFMDGISTWLAYHVWSLCPLAGGQESSTRYLELDERHLVPATQLGVPDERRTAWENQMRDAFDAYRRALSCWDAIGTRHPECTAIPDALSAPADEASRKRLARLRRNYRFDRARYYLPAATATNIMLVMSARGWAQLGRHLNSHPLPEARELARQITAELAYAAPRLLRHADADPGIAAGILAEFKRISQAASDAGLPRTLREDSDDFECPPEMSLDVHPPPDDGGAAGFAEDLQWHDNRYGWIGARLRRTAVRCRWQAVAMAEIRDMNRHRTGSKHCPLRPAGFYGALDQAPADDPDRAVLRDLSRVGRRLSADAHERLAMGDPTFIYHTLLGTQFPFERLTHADKFIYEAELRTGLGAHFRYARHYHDALALWYARFPETRGLIQEGNAEPE